MGLLITGLNKFRDFWSVLTDTAQIGTGTTSETNADTNLQTAISGSSITTTTATSADQHIVKQATFPGTKASGESVTEIVWRDSTSGKASSRITHNAITWQTDRDLKYRTRWYFKGTQG